MVNMVFSGNASNVTANGTAKVAYGVGIDSEHHWLYAPFLNKEVAKTKGLLLTGQIKNETLRFVLTTPNGTRVVDIVPTNESMPTGFIYVYVDAKPDFTTEMQPNTNFSVMLVTRLNTTKSYCRRCDINTSICTMRIPFIVALYTETFFKRFKIIVLKYKYRKPHCRRKEYPSGLKAILLTGKIGNQTLQYVLNTTAGIKIINVFPNGNSTHKKLIHISFNETAPEPTATTTEASDTEKSTKTSPAYTSTPDDAFNTDAFENFSEDTSTPYDSTMDVSDGFSEDIYRTM
ncbi:unnamed protein product [Dibothriocephalus latus]|uniref:Uncharacterized protein n=1 Tax=Dibothriocephalus latus TaxID=60516 RepID=A0A3P7LJL0_DIBLA|nr:unnamed protein product [Dibothriocephalus latus]